MGQRRFGGRLPEGAVRQLAPGAFAAAIHEHVEDGEAGQEAGALLGIGRERRQQELQGDAVLREDVPRVQFPAARRIEIGVGPRLPAEVEARRVLTSAVPSSRASAASHGLGCAARAASSKG